MVGRERERLKGRGRRCSLPLGVERGVPFICRMQLSATVHLPSSTILLPSLFPPSSHISSFPLQIIFPFYPNPLHLFLLLSLCVSQFPSYNTISFSLIFHPSFSPASSTIYLPFLNLLFLSSISSFLPPPFKFLKCSFSPSLSTLLFYYHNIFRSISQLSSFPQSHPLTFHLIFLSLPCILQHVPHSPPPTYSSPSHIFLFRPVVLICSSFPLPARLFPLPCHQPLSSLRLQALSCFLVLWSAWLLISVDAVELETKCQTCMFS